MANSPQQVAKHMDVLNSLGQSSTSIMVIFLQMSLSNWNEAMIGPLKARITDQRSSQSSNINLIMSKGEEREYPLFVRNQYYPR